mgnify:CR=1 FL=1
MSKKQKTKKELIKKLSKCITEKSVARGSNVILKNRKNKK